MESVSVYLNELKPILKSIQRQNIGIKIQNHHQSLSNQYFTIAEVKDLVHGDFKITILILYDEKNADSTAIDLKSIRGLELAEPLMINEREVKTIILKRHEQ